jgi:Holliday junction resolvase
VPNKNYQRGYRFEMRVKKAQEKNGWSVIRQGKSRFPDLVCFKPATNGLYEVKYIECKTNKYLSIEEKLKAHEIATKFPFFVAWNNKRMIDYYQIT